MEGVGDQIDYGMRGYDPRVGRFLSVDPLMKGFPMLTPYQYSSNSPIVAIDMDGLESISNFKAAQARQRAYLPTQLSQTNSTAVQTQNEVVQKTVHAVVAPPNTDHREDNAGIKATLGDIDYNKPENVMARVNPSGSPSTVSAPNPRDGYSDFEWGMITSPATQASIGLMVPGYNFAFGAALTYQGIKSGDKLQTGMGLLGMVGGGLELYARFTPTAAGAQLADLEANSGGHFLSRHGAETSLSSQYMRAVSGLTPEGEVLGEVNASRFLSDDLQLKAVELAQSQFSITGKSSFTLDMGETVGEGYLKGGGANSYRTTTQVQAVFKNGQLNTLYPLIQK